MLSQTCHSSAGCLPPGSFSLAVPGPVTCPGAVNPAIPGPGIYLLAVCHPGTRHLAIFWTHHPSGSCLLVWSCLSAVPRPVPRSGPVARPRSRLLAVPGPVTHPGAICRPGTRHPATSGRVTRPEAVTQPFLDPSLVSGHSGALCLSDSLK